MSDRTVQLHRVLRTPPEKVYRAFLSPDAMSKWLPPYGFTYSVQHFEAKVGGTFRMSFRNFTSGNAHSFGGEYLELVPNETIRYTNTYDDPNLPGAMQVSVRLTPVVCGTDLSIVQAGIPALIPREMCHLGWQESLVQLAALVEPDIPRWSDSNFTQETAMNPVVHFELPDDDAARASRFYETAFGWRMTSLGEETGNYITADTIETDRTGPTKPGAINGGLFARKPDWPAQYPSVVIAVDDIGAGMKKVVAAGGKVLGDPMAIPGVGQYASFTDTEGNRTGILQPLPRA